MTEIALYQVDAFADRLFTGNPAAVCPLEGWLPDATMQAIAAENNLAETAFTTPQGDHYGLRWFTPTVEVDLCGHATLAAAYVLWALHEPAHRGDAIAFETRSGRLVVSGDPRGRLAMDLPALPAKPALAPEGLERVLNRPARQVLKARDWVVVLSSQRDVEELIVDQPALTALLTATTKGSLIVTAPADPDTGWDFVSRFFAPTHGIPEDPVTGSAHCTLAPLWAKRLGKSEVVGRQLSARGGTVHCRDGGDRVTVAGTVAPYLSGRIRLP